MTIEFSHLTFRSLTYLCSRRQLYLLEQKSFIIFQIRIFSLLWESSFIFVLVTYVKRWVEWKCIGGDGIDCSLPVNFPSTYSKWTAIWFGRQRAVMINNKWYSRENSVFPNMLTNLLCSFRTKRNKDACWMCLILSFIRFPKHLIIRQT